MRRLDSQSFTTFNRWVIGVFVAVMSALAVYAFCVAPAKAWPFACGTLVSSLVILRWLSAFKEVHLDRDSLIVRDAKREERIPLSVVSSVTDWHWNKGLAHLTLRFRSNTVFGRRIRVMVGARGDPLDLLTADIRRAVEKHQKA